MPPAPSNFLLFPLRIHCNFNLSNERLVCLIRIVRTCWQRYGKACPRGLLALDEEKVGPLAKAYSKPFHLKVKIPVLLNDAIKTLDSQIHVKDTKIDQRSARCMMHSICKGTKESAIGWCHGRLQIK